MMKPMNKRLLHILCLMMALSCAGMRSSAQNLPEGLRVMDVQEDTLVLKKKAHAVNNYSMIGFEYGVSRNSMTFNPKYLQQPFITPGFYGITYTKYCRMMGMFPYFAIQVGAFHGTEGYQFKANEETGYISVIENASKAVYEVYEIPVLAQVHADASHFKAFAMVGPYGGYRKSIERVGQNPADEYEHAFKDTDRQIDYGLHGGAGFAMIFSPLEFHVSLRVRYSWSNIYDPDYVSPYYYRFGYPFDFMLSAGVHFQLSKRYGKTKAMIRREAYKSVFESDTEQYQK